jgi:pilus assembly protein TadC
MLVYVYLCLILGAVLILMGIVGSPTFKFRRRVRFIQDNAKDRRIQKLRSVLSMIFPFSKRLLETLKLEDQIKRKLDAAHVKLTPVEFFNMKLLFMVSLSISFFLAFGEKMPMAPVIALGLGYIIPEMFLLQNIAKRKKSIARLLPETVDLLGLCVEGGLDFTSAVKWIIEKTSSNPMVEELAFVLEEIKWGKPRTQALRDMAKRLNIPEVSSFVQTLVQAERMGTPVAEAFTILSEDTRLQRFHRGERFAMQAPIKILIPLIFCILPVIAIVIGGPIMLQFMQGGMLDNIGIGG